MPIRSLTALHALFAAEIALGCLYGNVPKQELDLLQLDTGCVTQTSAGSTQVMRRKLAESRRGRILPAPQ